MTDDNMNLATMFEKASDADLLRRMLGEGLQRLMELEAGAKAGAGYGEKSPDRLA